MWQALILEFTGKGDCLRKISLRKAKAVSVRLDYGTLYAMMTISVEEDGVWELAYVFPDCLLLTVLYRGNVKVWHKRFPL